MAEAASIGPTAPRVAAGSASGHAAYSASFETGLINISSSTTYIQSKCTWVRPHARSAGNFDSGSVTDVSPPIPGAASPLLTGSSAFDSSAGRLPEMSAGVALVGARRRPLPTLSYHGHERRTMCTTDSMTGTSTSTPTTVASAAPD